MMDKKIEWYKTSEYKFYIKTKIYYTDVLNKTK